MQSVSSVFKGEQLSIMESIFIEMEILLGMSVLMTPLMGERLNFFFPFLYLVEIFDLIR